MFGGVLCLLMLIFIRKLKKSVSLLLYICLNLHVLEAATKSCFTKCSLISKHVLQHSVKISVLVKLLYNYGSIKDKLPLKYFIKKIIEKNTSNS